MPLAQAEFPTLPVSLTKHPASLPQANISDSVDHGSITNSALQRLNRLSINDLANDAIWRDSLAFTGTLRTFFSAGLISKVWRELSKKHQPTNFAIIPDSSRVARFGPRTCWVEARLTFDIHGARPARCSGIIGLVPGGDESSANADWKIWLLSTILERPEGFPNVDDLRPVDSSGKPATMALNNSASCPADIDCLVVGAGIAGLCMAGRLESLGLSYVLVEKHSNVGDTWLRNRYESLKLHTSKEYNQLPGIPRTFRPQDVYHLASADLADGFQRYVRTFGINIALSTTLVSGSYDDRKWMWTLKLQRGDEIRTVRAPHVVLAVGNMGVTPTMPLYPNRMHFKGDVLHGLDWKNASPWKGKSGIVIGSANTAQGVIADMAKTGFRSITMVQRSRTFLLPTFTFGALVDPVYNEDTPTELSDRSLLGYPLPIQRLMAMAGIRKCADQNPEYFDRIQARGFDVERYGDLWGTMYDREGGHFFDLGAGELIANGTVKVRSGALPVAYTDSGLELSDGSRIDADVIVFATGYKGNIRDTARELFGDEVGQKLEEFWQCDQEGESRGAWKYIGRKSICHTAPVNFIPDNASDPGLWYTGHGYAHARYYSRFVAMQIKADVDGKPMEIYTETPSV